MPNPKQDDLKNIAREYFKRLDAGRPDLLELFTDDVQIYFPKFGLGVGRAAFLEIAQGLGQRQIAIEHNTADYLFIQSGNHLAVEGTTKGRFKNGEHWAAGETPNGRFCNVFEFRDGLISRLHVYLDPDGAGNHTEGFLWGREGRKW